MGNEYYRVISGHSVWVTLHWPWVYDEAQGGFVRPNRCCCTLAVGNPFKWTECELVVAEGQVRWFESGDAAVHAALAEAERRIAEQ